MIAQRLEAVDLGFGEILRREGREASDVRTDVEDRPDLQVRKSAPDIAAGNNFSMAVSSAGKVFVWGDNGSGEFGNGSTSGSSQTPTQVSNLSGTVVARVNASDLLP